MRRVANQAEVAKHRHPRSCCGIERDREAWRRRAEDGVVADVERDGIRVGEASADEPIETPAPRRARRRRHGRPRSAPARARAVPSVVKMDMASAAPIDRRRSEEFTAAEASTSASWPRLARSTSWRSTIGRGRGSLVVVRCACLITEGLRVGVRPLRVATRPLFLVLGAAVAACTGDLGDPPVPITPPPAAPDCSIVHAGSSPLRRLTRTEYDNTVRNLVGDTTRPGSGFPADEGSSGSTTKRPRSPVSSLLANQYLVASEQIAARATEHLDGLLGCDPNTDGEDACAATFVRSFLGRAFRRPADDATVARYLKLYTSAHEKYDFKTGMELVIEAALQSPLFLYRVEVYGSAPVAPNVVKLDPGRRDAALVPALELDAGRRPLQRREGRAARDRRPNPAQAVRMLDDPRAHDAVANFNEQWLGLTGMNTVAKDPTYYPDFDPELLVSGHGDGGLCRQRGLRRPGRPQDAADRAVLDDEREARQVLRRRRAEGRRVSARRAQPRAARRLLDPGEPDGALRQAGSIESGSTRQVRPRAAPLPDAAPAAGQHRASRRPR